MQMYSYSSYNRSRLEKILKVLPKKYSKYPLLGRLLNVITRTHPGYAEYLCRVGNLIPGSDALSSCCVFFCWARKDEPGLESQCRTAIMRSPGHNYARRMLGEKLEREGQMERALAVLGTEDTSAEPLPMLNLRSRLHIRRGDPDRAVRISEIGIARFPNNPTSFAHLGRAFIAAGQIADAGTVVAEAVEKFPRSPIFPALLSRILRLQGEELKSVEFEMACLRINPNDKRAIQSLSTLLQSVRTRPPGAMDYLDAYEAQANTAAADYSILRRIAHLKGGEPDVEAIRKIALAERSAPEELFDCMLAAAAVEDFSAAAKNLAKLIAVRSQDQRLIAYLQLYGEQIRPHLKDQELPDLDFLRANLRSSAGGGMAHELAKYRSGTIVNRVLERSLADLEAVRVSYLCPIHRPDDVRNLLQQIQRQKWVQAEVIFCINSPAIAEAQLALGPSTGFTVRIIRCEPGLPVGVYLNRCIDEASGDLLLRIDADDCYAADYTRYMVGFMLETGVDILSMDLCSVYFSDIDQTYLKRKLMPPSEADSNQDYRTMLGSGSSLCAKREVFQRLKFDESFIAGEDSNFYTKATTYGFSSRVVPNFFHTHVRHADKSMHTWKLDDFNILSSDSLFMGDGCVTTEPEQPATGVVSQDVFGGLFSSESLAWMAELRVEEALRHFNRPLVLIAGEKTPIVEQDEPLLTVTRQIPLDVVKDSKVVSFIPENPDQESVLARKCGAVSLSHDIIPELVVDRVKPLRVKSGLRVRNHKHWKSRFQKTKTRYLVLCNPRSGSEHLCSLLQSAGMGKPLELFREPVATVIGRVSSPEEYLENVFGRESDEPVFGTKIVTQYLFDHLDEERIGEIFKWFVSASFNIVRLRRADVDTAVSAYIAEQRGIWHHRNRPDTPTGKDGAFASLAPPPYDFPAISVEMKRLKTWSEKLDKLIERYVPQDMLLDLDYADVCSDSEAVVHRVAEFIGFDLLLGIQPVSVTRPISEKFPDLIAYRDRFGKEWQHAT